MKFLCRLDFDPSKILVPVEGGYAPSTKYHMKDVFVITFPRDRFEDIRQGDVIVVQFTKDMRRHYSVPQDNESSFTRATGTLIDHTQPWGERQVVRIYKCDPVRPGTDPESLYRLVLAWHDHRRTGLGGTTSGSVEGEIVFSIKGSSRSATGNHGDVFYLAVAKGPLSMTVMRTANLTGNVSMQEKVI